VAKGPRPAPGRADGVTHSVYCLATDVLDEGADVVVANIVGRGGAGSVTVAAKYHEVRDIYPHNPVRPVARVAPGVFWQPDRARYAGHLLSPMASPDAAGRDVLAELAPAVRDAGAGLDAWLVLFHHDEAGPGAAGLQRDCYGREMAGLLCPNGPGVRRLAVAMVEEVCGYPISTLRLESCHFHGLDHGHHHERLLEPMGDLARFLLGLCFCPGCMAMAGAAGTDGEGLSARARRYVEDIFSGARPPEALDGGRLADVLGPGTDVFLAAREAAVTGTAELLAQTAAAHGAGVNFIEPVIAARAYTDGVATGEPGPVRWGLGTNPASLAASGARLEPTGYLKSPQDLRRELGAYRPALVDAAVVLRPGHPDSAGPEALADKVAVAVELGFAEVNFYNYGLYRLEALDAVRRAITGT
jgi:hypothetical protein